MKANTSILGVVDLNERKPDTMQIQVHNKKKTHKQTRKQTFPLKKTQKQF